MSIVEFFKQPLEGKTSLSRVFWLYGVLGSLLIGCVELFLDAGNLLVIRVYSVLGLLYSVYATVGLYRCAKNSPSPFMARMARIGAVLTLLLLPVLAYLDLTGSLTLSGLLGDQVIE
jgi:hypothetical protein